MASTITRRPLPALIALLALLALTALVWWRVTNRDDATPSAASSTCTAPSTSSSVAAPRTLPLQGSIDVAVLNAKGTNGLAGKVRTTLMADGFRSSRPASDDPKKSSVTGVGQIRYSAANLPGAQLLQYYFPGARLVLLSTPSAQVTVSLGPNYTTLQPQRAVTAALAANKITQAATATPSAATGSSTRC